MGGQSTEFDRRVRETLRLPSDAPASMVMSAIDVLNAQACARLGLPANTPPAQIRATDRAVAAARAEALQMYRDAAAATQAPLRTVAGAETAEEQPRRRVPDTTLHPEYAAMYVDAEGDDL